MHADRALRSTHIRFRNGSSPYQNAGTPLPPLAVSLITNSLAERIFCALRKQRSYEHTICAEHPICLRFGAVFEV